ncbi:hypothetical protein ACLK2I_02495 [Escherichia coli]
MQGWLRRTSGQPFAAGLHYAQSLLFNRAAVGVVQQLRTDVMHVTPAIKRV